MSVTFSVTGRRDGPSLNVSNVNARDLLAWLGYPADAFPYLYGDVPARDLAARCRRRLWPEARNGDPELPSAVEATPGGAVLMFCGRPAGYLRERTEQLLAVAEAASDGTVSFD